MNKLKLTLISFVIIIFSNNSFSSSVNIKVVVQNEIITNLDIKNEKKYLLFLNPRLKKLGTIEFENIAKNSLITEIIKKKELEKYYDLQKKDDLINRIEENFFISKNIRDRSEFIEILADRDLSYEKVKSKIYIEALWNQLIFNKYSKNIKIDKDYLRQSILKQSKKLNRKFEFNLSEILIVQTAGIDLKNSFKTIYKSINEIGFENSANVFSESNTAKNGGLIGWVNELQISEKIKKKIISLKKNEISKPIEIQGGYLLIKLNDKREFQKEINLEDQVKELVNKERNRQLNSFSIIFYKRLKKNLQINEY